MGMITPRKAVPRRANAVSGVYFRPSHSIRIAATIERPICAPTGDRRCGWTLAKTAGSSRIRASENHVREAARLTALLDAKAELAMARKTMTQPPPQTARAIESQGLPPPAEAKPGILPGPKYTVAAYEVST